MRERGTRHRHADGLTHRHATTLAPPAVALLQQLEDFAASLPVDAAIALLRLLRSGLVAEAARHAVADEVEGYQHGWYLAHIATHHEHAGGVREGEEFFYLPSWFPAVQARSRTPPWLASPPSLQQAKRRGFMTERLAISSEQGSIEIQDPDSADGLAQALREPGQFTRFVDNPRGFVKAYGVEIDQKVSDRLHEALQGVHSAEELETAGYVFQPATTLPLTVGVVSLGVAVVATAKIAIAIAK